jgi:guanine deaminase
MEIEVGTLLTPEGAFENARLSLKGEGSLYVETALVPGFSDAHAHPQVVDYGGGRWSNAYEWMSGRRLKVDEAALRADVELSSKLAAAAMLRELLDGVTMVAVVGRGEANLRAYRRLPAKPRLVVLPTILESAWGWLNAWNALNLVVSLTSLDGTVPVGLFAHSLGHVSPESLKSAYEAARALNVPFGLHLSEGVDELPKLVSLLGLKEGEDSGVIAVHCISGSGYKRYGIKVVHCPQSNIALYGWTLRDVSEVDALGSDWPLLLGSALEAYKAAVEIHGRDKALSLLNRATAGGYRIYNLDWKGDAALFDEPFERVLEGSAVPKFVAVRGELAVKEGIVVGSGETRSDVEKVVRELIKRAEELYPAG